MLRGRKNKRRGQPEPATTEEATARTPRTTDRDGWYVTTLACAFVLLSALAAATMYVSFAAQYSYIAQFKDDQWAVLLEALSWDQAAFVFALLGLATAMRGKSALRARLGNLVCIVASALMNLAQADLSSPGSILVWMGPPLLYAAASDTIILEIQNRAMLKRRVDAQHATLWSVLGLVLGAVVGVLAWGIRLLLAPKSTATGFRTWYVDEVAYAPGRTEAGDRARQAELKAGDAEAIAARVRIESAAAITAADERADAAIAAARVEFEQQTERARQEEAARRAAVEADHEEQRTALNEELRRLREQSGKSVTDLRAEMHQALERTEHQRTEELTKQEKRYQGAMAEVRGELGQAQSTNRELRSEVTRLTGELQAVRASASGRQQIEWLYDELGQSGDPRYGDWWSVDGVAEELFERTDLESLTTARRYLREYVSKKRQGSSHVTGANGAMVGTGDAR